MKLYQLLLLPMLILGLALIGITFMLRSPNLGPACIVGLFGGNFVGSALVGLWLT